jgi:hypothetical protein
MSKTKKKVKNPGRQGDVGFFIAKEGDLKDATPIDTKGKKSFVFAFGESTGHKHQIKVEGEEDITSFVDFFKVKNRPNEVLFRAKQDVTVVHEEHGPIPLKKGQIVRSRIQRQYDIAARQEMRVVD